MFLPSPSSSPAHVCLANDEEEGERKEERTSGGRETHTVLFSSEYQTREVCGEGKGRPVLPHDRLLVWVGGWIRDLMLRNI